MDNSTPHTGADSLPPLAPLSVPEGIAIEIKPSRKRCRAKPEGAPRKRPVSLNWDSPELIERLSKLSHLTNAEISKILDITEANFYEHVREGTKAFESIAHARATANEKHDDAVESAFYQAACGTLPKKTTTFPDGRVMVEYVFCPDANRRWLQKRRGAKWKTEDGSGNTGEGDGILDLVKQAVEAHLDIELPDQAVGNAEAGIQGSDGEIQPVERTDDMREVVGK